MSRNLFLRIGHQRALCDDLNLKLPALWNAVLFPLCNAGLRKAQGIGRTLLSPEVGNNLIEVHGPDYRNSFSICQRGSDIYFARVGGI